MMDEFVERRNYCHLSFQFIPPCGHPSPLAKIASLQLPARVLDHDFLMLDPATRPFSTVFHEIRGWQKPLLLE
jgi:hypothetical protein